MKLTTGSMRSQLRKNEYQSKINSLIDENIFKLITNPLFFNQNLSWQDRRKTLLEIVGDISDQDVIDSNKELSRLSVLLQDKTLEEFKAMIAGQKKRLNDALKQIPVRIDELSRNIPTLDAEVDYSGLEQERKGSANHHREFRKGFDGSKKNCGGHDERFQEKSSLS